jgi:hypothetical protein
MMNELKMGGVALGSAEGAHSATEGEPSAAAELERIAKANKVSLAWVVRQAAEKCVRDVEAAGKKAIASNNE